MLLVLQQFIPRGNYVGSGRLCDFDPFGQQ